MNKENKDVHLPIQQLKMSKKRIPIAHKETKRQQRIFFSVTGLLFMIAIYFIDIDFQTVSKGMERVPIVAEKLTQ